MRVAIGEFSQETNAFNPLGTDRDRFDVVAGEAMRDAYAGTSGEVAGFVDALADSDAGVDVAHTRAAYATPGGPVADEMYDSFAGALVADVAAADPDAVLLALHGAMATRSRVDPEGHLLEEIRDVVGDRPLVASLDHHADVTPRMVDAADAFVAYREHPHTGEDTYEVGVRAAELTVDCVRGRIDPRMALVTAPMIVTDLSTHTGAMRTLFEERARVEATTGAALAVNLCPVQPWLDAPGMGFDALVVTDGAPSLGRELAADLAERAWDRRAAFGESLATVDEAIDEAVRRASADGPVVLSDRGDVTLAGAPGDSPVILRRLLERADATDLAAAAQIVDPDAVDALAGREGDRCTVPVGGTVTPGFEPLELDCEVETVARGPLPVEGSYGSGRELAMGTRVVVRVADRDVRVLLTVEPGLPVHPSFFGRHGIDPVSLDLLPVKSVGTFRPNYESVAAAFVNVDTPGISSFDLSRHPYERARPVYPLDAPEPTFDA